MDVRIGRHCFLLWICLCLLIQNIYGDVTVQDLYECGDYRHPKIVRIVDRDEDTISSQSQDFYSSDRNCILVIIGKRNYQIELEITKVDVDEHAYATEHCGGLCCNDYLKMFNSLRVDNARLLAGISQFGICGDQLPQKVIYTTTQNFVTIQFKTDGRSDSRRGFGMRFRQFPWQFPTSQLPEGGQYGGWNDGTFTLLQLDWSDQNQVPGGYLPGTPGNNYDKDEGGVSCYECQQCQVDYYLINQENKDKRSGCYVCSKSWKDEFAVASRMCYTKMQYTYLLKMLIDPTVGGGEVLEFRGCQRFLDSYGVGVNYCVCDTDMCNGGEHIHITFLTGLAVIAALFFQS